MRLTSFTDFALRALMRLAGEPAQSFAALKARLAAAREALMRELDATTLDECAYPARPKRSPVAGTA
jgi:hypothetical protein